MAMLKNSITMAAFVLPEPDTALSNMTLIENKNMASFDPNKETEAKFDAIEKKIKDKMGDKYEMTITNYDDIRDLLGTKLMREIHLKK